MDEMKGYEVNDYLDNLEYNDKVAWEQTRFQSYITAQVNSSKKIKPTDIINFSWDKEKSNDEDIEIATKDINRLKELANRINGRNT